MEGPFRSAPTESADSAPRDGGIVGDVIAQFADPLAFYRELVQNSIDAGTPSVEVRIEHDAGAGLVRASVRDQGEGMDRDVVENQLMVMFRSTKERDPTKIGKFGIGFKSVLAPEPRAVVVSTARGGRKLTLHLYPDLHYELFDVGPARASGTTVELQLAMEAGAVDGFVRASHAALERWCRHASVPIRLIAPGLDVRVDRPLALDGALVQVSAGGAVVGLMPEAAPYAGFFNHGLMLYETQESPLGRVAFKVQDSELGHTLSRDNVLRNAAYARAVARVDALARQELAPAALRELAAAAGVDGDRYVALLEAIVAADLEFFRQDVVVPLLEPGGGRIAVGELPTWRVHGASRRSALTAAFAAQGKPVIDLGVTPRALLRRFVTGDVIDLEEEYLLVAPIVEEPHDAALLQEVGAMLDAAHRAPASLVFADVEGGIAHHIAMSGELGVNHVEHARRTPFRFLLPRPMILSARHPHVVAARRRAAADPIGAASLLARAVLVHYGALDRERSARLLAHTVARMGAR